MDTINAVSPLDGRYQDKVKELSPFVSEAALIRARFKVEIEYLVTLSKFGVIKKLSPVEIKKLKILSLTDKDIKDIKTIEDKIHHDVKSVEVKLREMLKGEGMENLLEMLHFGLTSEDVNNISYRILLRDALDKVVLPKLHELLMEITHQAREYKDVKMLARTHGQGAVPTTFGKELAVFASRINVQMRKLEEIKLTGKMNGAVGNFNSYYYSYPEVDWLKISKYFISNFGFEYNLTTTQINHFDDIVETFQNIMRINLIILGFNQDLWRYISDDWISQKVDKNQVGSSTMAQKVNPIDFENSEGNIQIANGIIEAMCRSLMVSRLQRDLSNSTIIRNLSSVMAYVLLAYKSTLSGLRKIYPNKEKMLEILNSNWAILSEALQTELRKNGVSGSYNKIKDLSIGKKFTKQEWLELIRKLDLPKELEKKLLTLTPENYIGIASKITDITIDSIKGV